MKYNFILLSHTTIPYDHRERQSYTVVCSRIFILYGLFRKKSCDHFFVHFRLLSVIKVDISRWKNQYNKICYNQNRMFLFSLLLHCLLSLIVLVWFSRSSQHSVFDRVRWFQKLPGTGTGTAVPGSKNEKRAAPVRFLKYHVEPETDPLKYQIDMKFFQKIWII
jgi:hypothetical protein